MQSPGMALMRFCVVACSALLALLLNGRVCAQTQTVPILLPDSHTIDATQPATTTLFLPAVAGPPPAKVVIAAAHIDSSLSYEPDEAILLWNTGFQPQPMAGWALLAGNGRAAFPISSTLVLTAGQRIWCTAEATAFRLTFGEDPACVWGARDEGKGSPLLHLDGDLQLNNRGGAIRLVDAAGERVDLLLYGAEDTSFADWHGPPVQPYDRGAMIKTGQVLTRKQHPHTLQPLDSDRSTDWQSDLTDIDWGRRVRYPGWRGWTQEDGALAAGDQAGATVTVAIGPEGLYPVLARALDAAHSTIDLSIYTLEHPELTARLVAALERGVHVRLLLEGSPPGGISNLQKWCVAQLAKAGADVRYLAPVGDAPNGLRPRYAYAHAKYGLIDGRTALVGTDNFNRDSMPVQSTLGGRRGVYLITDALPVMRELTRIFEQDWAPHLFGDLRPFDLADERYGGPPPEFVLADAPSYPTADEAFRNPVTSWGEAQFAIISAPENALRPDNGLLALLAQAGAGDEILVQQLYEHKYWGASESNPIADPNPRLEAMLDAARRGARVRILLDSFFDEENSLRSNRATVDYVSAVAAAEGLDLAARTGNPTGGGIHAKMVLLKVGDTSWSAVGSLNGSEASHKLNRELVLLLDLPPVHARLVELFAHDWTLSASDQ
jgi:cardiolipin synthase